MDINELRAEALLFQNPSTKNLEFPKIIQAALELLPSPETFAREIGYDMSVLNAWADGTCLHVQDPSPEVVLQFLESHLVRHSLVPFRTPPTLPAGEEQTRSVNLEP